MIDRITDEQRQAIRDLCEKYRRIGLNCEPLDKDAAVRAVSAIYEQSGNKRPQRFLFLGSPAECLIHIREEGAELEPMFGQLAGYCDSQLSGHLSRKLVAELFDQLTMPDFGELAEEIGRHLYKQFPTIQLWNYFAGQHWCRWVAVYEAAGIAGVVYTQEQARTIRLWRDQAESCHWWFPYRDLVVLSERHVAVSENDWAVRYPDGWGVAAIHLTRS